MLAQSAVVVDFGSHTFVVTYDDPSHTFIVRSVGNKARYEGDANYVTRLIADVYSWGAAHPEYQTLLQQVQKLCKI